MSDKPEVDPQSDLDPLHEAPASPDPIVDWQPHRRGVGHRLAGALGRARGGGGALALGALAVGAVAVGALAIGSLAIGRLAVGRARIRTLRIDRLIIGRIEEEA